MLLDRFTHKSYPFKTVLALQLTALTDDQFHAGWVVLSRAGSKLHVKVKDTFQASLTEILEKLPAKYPVALTIDGKGVLYKTGDPDWVNPQQVFRELVPQSDFRDFYQQLIPHPELLWVALARKSNIQPVLQLFKEKSFSVIDLQLGPFRVEGIYPLLEHPGENWQLPAYGLQWDGSLIMKIVAGGTPEPFDFVLGDEKIPIDVIIPFAHAFTALMQADELNNAFPDILEGRMQYLYKQRIAKTGIAVLLFYLIILLGNYLLFTDYSQKLTVVQASYRNNLKTISKLEQLVDELRQKELLVKKTGFEDRTQLSYLADRLAATVPENITLTQIAINPLTEKMRSNETPRFVTDQMVISGELPNATRLYFWVEKLKNQSWVTSVEVETLEQETADKPAIFTLQLVYRFQNPEPVKNKKQP